MKKKKMSDLLTICLKAGKAVKGFDSTADSVRNGKAFCVLTACDASEKTVKEAAFVCGRYGIPIISTDISKDEMAVLCGKTTAVIAVCDQNFADGFAKLAAQEKQQA